MSQKTKKKSIQECNEANMKKVKQLWVQGGGGGCSLGFGDQVFKNKGT